MDGEKDECEALKDRSDNALVTVRHMVYKHLAGRADQAEQLHSLVTGYVEAVKQDLDKIVTITAHHAGDLRRLAEAATPQEAADVSNES